MANGKAQARAITMRRSSLIRHGSARAVPGRIYRLRPTTSSTCIKRSDLPRQRSPFGSASTRRHREVLNLGAAFFAIFLITRFVAWWWEWMPKYLFFFLVGAIALGLLTAFRQLRACGRRRMKHVALLAAGAVVIASNAVALIGVALNRSGVTQEIDLTERELTIDKLGEDNSGVSLHLRFVNSVPSDGPGWLGADKLAELG